MWHKVTAAIFGLLQHHLYWTDSWINVWRAHIDENLKKIKQIYSEIVVKYPYHIAALALFTGWTYMGWYCHTAEWDKRLGLFWRTSFLSLSSVVPYLTVLNVKSYRIKSISSTPFAFQNTIFANFFTDCPIFYLFIFCWVTINSSSSWNQI